MNDVTIMLMLIGVCLGLAGYFKGKLDAIVDEEVKELEWGNKYDFTKSGDTKHWWYLGLYTPKFPEKFPFSTTILVFLTDKWHRTQFYMLRSFYLALAIGISGNLFTTIVFAFVIFPILVGIPFELTYSNYRKTLREKYRTKSSFPQGDKPQQEQVTSIPEKQITDELH